VTVLLETELLTLGRACGVIRRRNIPVRDLSVDSSGPGGLWRLSCVLDADELTVNGIVSQISNVIGVHAATVTPILNSKAVS
jgi:acetolactate synthase small subunit